MSYSHYSNVRYFHNDFSVFLVIEVFCTRYQHNSALASFTPINRKVFSIFDFFSTQSTLLQFLTRIFLYILRFKLLIVRAIQFSK